MADKIVSQMLKRYCRETTITYLSAMSSNEYGSLCFSFYLRMLIIISLFRVTSDVEEKERRIVDKGSAVKRKRTSKRKGVRQSVFLGKQI